MECKVLKPYKGMIIEKTYELKADGTIGKHSIVYTAFTEDYAVFDSKKTLMELKKEIDNYMRKLL